MIGGKMRTVICLGLCLALAGCVTTQQRESSEQLKARSEAATAACRAQPLTSFTERAQCLNDASMIAASTAEYPDLLQKALAARLEIAQRVDAKKVTPAEGAKQYSKIESGLADEAKKRRAADLGGQS
jgi:acyl-CoA hydrolase